MPVASANYRMADRLVGGRLDGILNGYVNEGLSNNAVARRLFADHQIEVSPTTVAVWLNRRDREAVA